MTWKTGDTVSGNARRILPKLAEEYFDAGRAAAAGKQNPKALHRFRIRTKRFRYALELFRPVYGPTLDQRLKAIHKLQDALGKISDQQTILDLIGDDDAIVKRVTRTLKRKSKEFRKEWEAFDSGGQLEQWQKYLARAARGASSRRGKRSPGS